MCYTVLVHVSTWNVPCLIQILYSLIIEKAAKADVADVGWVKNWIFKNLHLDARLFTVATVIEFPSNTYF